MPELPEVERAARVAREALVGERIARVRVFHRSQRRTFPDRMRRAVAGDVVTTVERRGKYQLFRLASGRVIEVHFRMTGDWIVAPVSARYQPPVRVAFELERGRALLMHDSRALGTVTLHEPEARLLESLGPEAIHASFNGKWLATQLAAKRGAIKPALLDQHLVAGVGNIYACESLWRAEIKPDRPARSLTALECNTLVRSVKTVLRRAMREEGRYYGAQGTGMRFAVYDRAGEPCVRCGTRIARTVLAGRGTEFCPGCQR